MTPFKTPSALRISLVASLLAGAFSVGCSSSSTPTTPDAGHPEDAGSCPTAAAAIKEIGVSAACASCVEEKCPTQACTCSKDARCVQVEVCAEQCLKAGKMSAMGCAELCITDAGGQSTPAGTSAYDLDECFALTCSSECGAS